MGIPFGVGLHGYDAKAVTLETAVDPEAEFMFNGELVAFRSPTQQAYADEVNINTIVKRFGITGSMPFGPATPMYGDFTCIDDFDAAVRLVDGTWEAFMQLPAELREKFHNSPSELVRYAQSVSEEEFLEGTRVAPPAPPAEPVS